MGYHLFFAYLSSQISKIRILRIIYIYNYPNKSSIFFPTSSLQIMNKFKSKTLPIDM